MANKFRAEYTVKLGGKSYKARPSFDAICNFEDETGTGCLELCRTLREGRSPKIKHIVAAVWAGINGYGKEELSLEDVGEMVLEDGAATHIDSFIGFILGAVSGAEETETPAQEGEAPK